MTGSGDNKSIFANIVLVQKPGQAYAPSHTHTAYILSPYLFVAFIDD